MKKSILLCGLLLAATASLASAASGVNLRWNACIGDAGASNRNFACNVNTGTNLLVGSFEVGADLADVSGNEIIVDLASADPTLPAWWQFRNAGTCRTSSMTFNTVLSAAAINCFDWANGGATGGVGAYNVGTPTPNCARLIAASAVPASGLAILTPATEYFSFNLLVNNLKTVGTGSCLGCQSPVCIVFNSLNLTTPIAANNRKLFGPANGTDSNFATWQGGLGVTTSRGQGCPAATPTRSTTWGSVKSLYR